MHSDFPIHHMKPYPILSVCFMNSGFEITTIKTTTQFGVRNRNEKKKLPVGNSSAQVGSHRQITV